MIHMCVAYNDGVHTALLLYGPKIWNRILRCRLPDPGIQKDSSARNPYIDTAPANLHGASKKM